MDGMILRIELDTESAAFKGYDWGRLRRDSELARILRDLARQLELGEIRVESVYTIYDQDGNRCGSVTYGVPKEEE
jgi:hypothetical protein